MSSLTILEQRPPRLPDVKRGDVAVADGFLARRLLRDGLQGERNLDEAFGARHRLTPPVSRLMPSVIRDKSPGLSPR
jgi:hypothetical protein